MTRQEVEAHYDIEAGIIVTPGKFEGEPPWVPALWHGDLDYDFFDGDMPVSRVEVDAELVADWPELANDRGRIIFLWESSQGFVHSAIHSRRAADHIQEQCEQFTEEEGNADDA